MEKKKLYMPETGVLVYVFDYTDKVLDQGHWSCNKFAGLAR